MRHYVYRVYNEPWYGGLQIRKATSMRKAEQHPDKATQTELVRKTDRSDLAKIGELNRHKPSATCKGLLKSGDTKENVSLLLVCEKLLRFAAKYILSNTSCSFTLHRAIPMACVSFAAPTLADGR